jgi:hypothetical protein
VNVVFLPTSVQAYAQLETELALISFDIAANPPHPTMKVYLAAYMKLIVTKLQSKAALEYNNL